MLSTKGICFHYRIIAVLVFLQLSFAGDFFADRGSLWFSGSIGYNFIKTSNIYTDYFDNDTTEDKYKTSQNIFSVSPSIRFFPARFFYVGALFQWQGYFVKIKDETTEKYNINFLNPGALLGFAFNKNTPVIPYVETGFTYNHSTYNYEEYMDMKMKGNGFSLPLECGVLIPLNGVGLQFGLRYQFQKYHTEEDFEEDYHFVNDMTSHTISINIGLCAIGKKCAGSLIYSGMVYPGSIIF